MRMTRTSLLFCAAILAVAMLVDSSALVRLVLLTGVAVLLVAAWRFPRRHSQTSTPPAIQIVRLTAAALVGLVAIVIALFALLVASCRPAGCV